MACLTGGIAAAAAYNAAGATKQDGSAFTPADFLPEERRQQTPEEMMTMCELLNTALGGTTEVQDGRI